jgi:hypothetical protein
MTGSAIIVGLIPCSNGRYPYNDKPRTIVMDAEVVIGFDEDDNVQTVPAVLAHFIKFGEEAPQDNLLYFISGRVASSHSSIHVDSAGSSLQYDLYIEADVVCLLDSSQLC